MSEQRLTVSQFIETLNQTLDYTFPEVVVEGEVSGFKVNQGKWVFFDLKDEESSVSCFLPLFKLRMALEDGMKIVVKAEPKLTKWGKFSLTIQQMKPAGEGALKKNFELLKKKLEKEGLFDPERKREIPENLHKIGVISSTQAAGYADFCKILNARWGGLEVLTAHCQVQGMSAPDQIIRALKYFNEKAEVDIIAILRGGGSADDLAAFNDELLVREIAASRIPVITGIGHEVDESLADLAADIRASTPSNVAELLTLDKQAELAKVKTEVKSARSKILQEIEALGDIAQDRGIRNKILQEMSALSSRVDGKMLEVQRAMKATIDNLEQKIVAKTQMIEAANPMAVLKRGYAIVSGKIAKGSEISLQLYQKKVKAKITEVEG